MVEDLLYDQKMAT